MRTGGVIWTNAEIAPLVLAPTFDHGAGLARNLQDGEREERLTTRDNNRSLLTFAAKGRSAFYESPAAPKPLPLMDAFQAFARRAPAAARLWQERLRAVTKEAVYGILSAVPGDRMSNVCRDFTARLLEVIRERLLEGEELG